MRKVAATVFLLLLGSAILGSTVLREQLAQAAAPIASVFVSNDASSPIPVREQNLDANGNAKVHEQGIANVSVNGVVTTQTAPPAGSFSLVAVIGYDLQEGCDQSLPAGTRWFITSFAAANTRDLPKNVSLDLRRPPGALVADGPNIALGAHETAQLTFPQPFVLTSPVDGACLWGATDPYTKLTVAGYRK